MAAVERRRPRGGTPGSRRQARSTIYAHHVEDTAWAVEALLAHERCVGRHCTLKVGYCVPILDPVNAALFDVLKAHHCVIGRVDPLDQQVLGRELEQVPEDAVKAPAGKVGCQAEYPVQDGAAEHHLGPGGHGCAEGEDLRMQAVRRVPRRRHTVEGLNILRVVVEPHHVAEARPPRDHRDETCVAADVDQAGKAVMRMQLGEDGFYFAEFMRLRAECDLPISVLLDVIVLVATHTDSAVARDVHDGHFRLGSNRTRWVFIGVLPLNVCSAQLRNARLVAVRLK